MFAACRASRQPEEIEKFQALLATDGDPRPVLEDIFWALLNSREFLFNH